MLFKHDWRDECKKVKNKKAPRTGFEPVTYRLTAGCSAIELSRNICLLLSLQVVEIIQQILKVM